MKTILVILTSIALALPLTAAFEKWTNKEGKAVELKLVEVTGEGEEIAGVFMMRNGRKATIKKADLSEESAELFETRKADLTKPAGSASVFDEVLDGNLVILDGKRLKAHSSAKKPTKYYVFYYTASWCPPCRAFTPELIKFYNKHKSETFELVLISSDGDKKAMEAYATKDKMPWPQVKFSKVKTFKGKFDHGVTGIPAVIVCDLEGKIVSNNGRDLEALEKLVK